MERRCAVSAVACGMMLVAGCNGRKERASERVQSVPATVAPIAQTALAIGQGERTQIAVSLRVELFSILFFLAGSPEYNSTADTPYSAAVHRHFEPFRDHPAVVASRVLRSRYGVSHDAPMGLAAHLTDPPELAPIAALTPLPDALDERWSDIALDDYLAKVRAFVSDTDFMAFMAEREGYFNLVAQRYRDSLEPGKVVAWFDGFFGPRAGARYRIVPGLLTGAGSYGVTAVAQDGAQLLYQIVSLENLDRSGLPVLTRSSEAMLVHEMAHAYINPMVSAHRTELEAGGRALFALVQATMEQQAYRTWEVVVIESLVRACTIRYLADVRGDVAAVAAIGQDEERSFYWIAELVELIQEYAAGPGPRGELGAFMPRIGSFFEQWAATHADRVPQLPFRGPINSVYAQGRAAATVYVYPDSTPELRSYAQQLRDRVVPEASLAAASTALGSAGSHRSIVSYGSPSTNPLTHRLLGELGWTITDARVTLGKHAVDGDHLVLIASYPNPTDPTQAVLLYTAADDRDLVAPNNLVHGATDWIVGRHLGGGEYESIASGDFPKRLDGSWSNPR